MALRLEEMNTDDLIRLSPHCDTAIMAIGGLAWQPSHLPTGASWYIVRRLRDSLERSLGGRVLTLPVLPFTSAEDQNALFALAAPCIKDALSLSISRLRRVVSLKHIVLLTGDTESETILQTVLADQDDDAPTLLPYVWWRDGLGPETSYHPAGEAQTSLLLAISGRLVDSKKPSALETGATRASAAWGRAILERMEEDLRTRVEGLWTRASLDSDDLLPSDAH